jgi:hypothetical protein
MKTNKSFWAMVVLSAFASGALASPPYVNYQGLLNGASGQPLPTGNYSMEFNIYSQAQGGTRVWGPFVFDGGTGAGHGPIVAVANGHFNVIIGPLDTAGNSLASAFATPNSFIEMRVNGGSPILPRQQFLSTPYAFGVIGPKYELTTDSLLVKSNNVMLFGDRPLPAVNGVVRSLSTNLTISGAGTNANSRKITLDGDVLITGASAAAPSLAVAGESVLNDVTLFGTSTTATFVPPPAQGNRGSHIHWGSTGDWYIRSATNAGTVFIQDSGGNVAIGGRLGIGAGANGIPQYPLHVRASQTASLNLDVGDLRNYDGGVWRHNSEPNTPYSIVADQFVLATAFQATSDRRIKEVAGPSDRAKDLDTVRKLAVTDYHFVEKQTKGDRLQKGFIAQEVKAIMPEAVTATANFIPDIYARATASSHNHSQKSLAITLAKAHGLKIGDRVRLISSSTELDLPIEAIPSGHEFVVGNCERDPGRVFVYGKYVTDFLSVDYDRIFTTGISAIQELAKRVDALESTQRRLAEVQQKAERVDALEREVAELKTLLKEVAQTHGVARQVAEITPAGN